MAYVEQPYQGIYKPTPELVESITEFFGSADGTAALFIFQATVLEATDTYILVEPVAGINSSTKAWSIEIMEMSPDWISMEVMSAVSGRMMGSPFFTHAVVIPSPSTQTLQ